MTPIISDDGVSYLYVQYSNLYLLIVTRENANAASMLLFLHKLRGVFVHYFNELEEESLRDNFVIAYELLDEVCASRSLLWNAVEEEPGFTTSALAAGDGLRLPTVH